jgi:hypothetical protein
MVSGEATGSKVTAALLSRSRAWGQVMRLFLVVASLLSFAFLTAARGEERIALVVANSSVAGAPELTTVRGSAGLIAETLTRGGFKVTVVNEAGGSAFVAALQNFVAELRGNPTSIALFYYAGYAAQADGLNYLLPVDATPASPADLSGQAIPLDVVLLSAGIAQASVVVLDAAHGVPHGAEPGLAPVDAPAGVVVAFSSQPGTTALDGNGATSAFAEAFAAALGEPYLDIDMVMRRTGERVAATTAGRQMPWTASNLSGESLVLNGVDRVPARPLMPSSPEPQEDFAEAPSGGGGTGGGGGGWGGGYSDPFPMDSMDNYFVSPDELSGSGYDAEAFAAERQRYEEEAARRYAEEQARFEALKAQEAAKAAQGSQGEHASGGESPVIGDYGIEPSPPGGQYSPDPVAPGAEPPMASGGGIPGVLYGPSLTDAVPGGGVPQPIIYPPPAAEPLPPDGAAPAMENLGGMYEGEPPAAEPADTMLVRYPMLEAPDGVVAAEVFSVSVALTEDKLTPEATARAAPTTSLTAEGAFKFSLPAQAEQWPIDIDLLAPGFDLAEDGEWGRRVTLYKDTDSDIIRFKLKARAISEASKPRQLMVRFYHSGRFLGSASRAVTVLREVMPTASGAPLGIMSAAPEMLKSSMQIGDEIEVPDLDVTIHYDDPDLLGKGRIYLHSPHIAGPVTAEFTTPAGMTEWLNSEYLRLVQLGLRLRGGEPAPEVAWARGATSLAEPTAGDAPAQIKFVTKVAEGFGDDLYRNYVPQPFKDLFWSLRQRGLVRSIQITSNSPVLPWELVRPRVAEGAISDGFLGINYRLARWAPRSTVSQVDQPLNRMSFTGVAAVAPAYENNLELPFQRIELEALSKLAGFRMVGGDFSAFQKLVGEVSTGFIHFSGHGVVNNPGTGAPVFAIRLADQSLDPTTWRALTFAPREKGNPFYFFNACDTGRAASLGGFVQGWGPAILASGASGFIGGMWPLADRTAASFSTEFYGGVAGHLAEGPVYLAEVLQQVRKRFYETGDPTYLAYTFYGNANLQVVAQ